MTKIFGFLFNLQQSGEDKTFPSLGWKPTTMTFFAHLSLPWSIVLVALSFLGCCRRRPTMVTPDQISTLFNIYRPYTNPVSPNTKQYQAILTQYHQVPTSTAFYWLSTIIYQPVPPSTNQYPPILTRNHQEPTRTAPYWPSTTKYQPVLTSTDPVSSYIIFQYQTFLCRSEMSTVVR